MSTLGFILLLGLTAPQNQVVAVQQNDLPSVQWTWSLTTDTQVVERVARGKIDCYAIRSYIFHRQDGNAPVLIGTSTCTPANANRTLQVGRPPKAGLVPL